MADQKQLILVVEATAAMGPYWHNIFTYYLRNIIRCFCGNVSATHKTPAPAVELALVTYYTHGSNSAWLVQRSGWTSHPEVFFMWLSSIPFSGGGFSDAAIAEGLGEALTMLASPNGSQAQQHADFQRHCILIASSNPYPLPTPIYRPRRLKSEQSDNNEAQSHSRLCDAETVAKSFSECSVSLSVICPKQLPKLRAIYNAGKHSLHGADPPIDNVKTPGHLVLISENFMEALSALKQIRVKMEVSSVPLVSLPPATSIPSVNGCMTNWQQVQPTMQSLVVNNNATANVPPSQQKSSAQQSAKSKYAKVWEGNLCGQQLGHPAFITILEAYRSVSASATLACNWPETMRIVRLISEDNMRAKYGEADFLVFRAMTQHRFLGQLQEKKLCAVIRLPSQTLLLSVSDRVNRLIGLLFPGDMVMFTSTTTSTSAASRVSGPTHSMCGSNG